MSNQLIVSEKYSRYWPAIAAGSLIVSALFLAGYIYTSNVLLESYLRLGAFAFFVVGFLSLFKLRDGKIKILYELDNEKKTDVKITYSVRDQNIHAESIDLSEIKSIKVDQMPNRSLYNDFYKADRSVRLKKKNMDGWLYLNEIHGRAIPLSQANAEKIVNFIRENKDQS